MRNGRVEAEADYLPDPAVLQSWQRCISRLDPLAAPRPAVRRGSSLTAVLKAQADLVTLAIPYMEDIHQFIEGSGCAILLADGTACILLEEGDPELISLIRQRGLGQGVYWSEGQLGTNALGMALTTAMPVQVVGAEHFFAAYHDLTTTAAPIHDVNGRIIGIFAVVGLLETATSHTLSLVMAAARAISNQLQTDLFLEEANRRLSEVSILLEAITEGVVAWDELGNITHVNTQAGEILDVNPTAINGQPIVETFNLPRVVEEAVTENKPLYDVEAKFIVNGRPVPLLLNLRLIYEGSEIPVGYMLMFRPIEAVRRLVQQQVGAQAALTLEDFSGQSSTMQRLLRQGRIAARGTAPVLLRGEGGVGKNLLAHAIHNASQRADKPFLAINCRAVPHELMTREFMGYEEDNGQNGRPSKFELAHGGTLLLDQIESLSLEMQAALLHVIETGHVLRLNSTYPIPVNVRIIAATSSNLEQKVTEGSFLSHLYYRFGVFNLTVPPLRERVEDIPFLAKRFLSRIERSSRIEKDALQMLERYPWPGNVRELENVLERALGTSQDGIIRVADLPDVVIHGRVLTTHSPAPQPVVTVAEAERDAILRAGWMCQGHVTQMAEQLEIGRTTLWRKMKRLDISPEQFKR